MAVAFGQLAQQRVNGTSAVSVLSPSSGQTYIIPAKGITILNQSGAACNATLYLDDDGTTYDETTQILGTIAAQPGIPLHYDGPITMNNASGNLALKPSVSDALTISIWGATKT